MSVSGLRSIPGLLVFLLLFPASPAKGNQDASAARSLAVPMIDVPPAIEDFIDMEPSERFRGRLAKVENFIQTIPSDGKPATQRTVVYLGYDERNLYAVFVAFDTEPQRVRGTMARRENLDDNDDWIELALDTFADRRRAYLFDCNPLGVQWDALYSEGGGENASFDTLWHSQGRITGKGFVVWMAIPFKSLRFPALSSQTWGIQFRRWQSRIPEMSAWPHISSRVQGRLNQAATLTGLSEISPGRNLQFIPYSTFRSFRALDTRDPLAPRFRSVGGEFDAGLDAKVVFRDSLVLDGTINPDFNQVESDDPQVTANQRFEVFFPEKRPFFQENATYFETPINLVFTRRIADPQFGARLTGKAGPYAVGAMFIDDQSPGKLVPENDPASGERARFGILRVNRDILNQSSVGMIYTDREFPGAYNRVGGATANFKLGRNWTSSFQGVSSWTRLEDGTRLAGPAWFAGVERNGRQLNFQVDYNDVGEGFLTETGFVNRTGFRELEESVSYRFRPEGRFLVAWGPDLTASTLWDRRRTRLDRSFQPALNFELTGQTRLRAFYTSARERLRPEDFPVMEESLDFGRSEWGFSFSSSILKRFSFSGSLAAGQAVNVVPPPGRLPHLANSLRTVVRMNLRPVTPLRIQTDYILSRLTDRAGGAGIFNNHIIRANCNWQFDRRLSIRAILQYDALLTNPGLTRLATVKNFNADFLISYLINPGTAFFLGYNSNLQNMDLVERDWGTAIVRNPDRFINDGRQLFFKVSYLFRY